MSRFLKRISAIVLTVCITLSLVTFSVSAAVTNVWTTNSYVNVFRDALPTMQYAGTNINYLMGRNEYESAQIMVRSDTAFTITGVDFTDLTSGANTIPASNLRYNYVKYFNMSNSQGQSASTAVRWVGAAKGYFPDMLSNDATIDVAADSTQPIWITVYSPKTTVAAIYTGTATVHTDAGDFAVPINTEVVDLDIPDSKDANFGYEYWQQLSNTWKGSANDPSNYGIKNLYGHDKYTPAWWALMDDVAKMLKENRINTLTVYPMDLLIDAGTTLTGDVTTGTYNFEWARFDEFIQFFIANGDIIRLEGNALLNTNYGSNTRAFTLVPNLAVPGTLKAENSNSNPNTPTAPAFNSTTNPTALLPQYANFYNQYLNALRVHLQDKGWYSIWNQHIEDEPISSREQKEYKVFADFFRARMPGIPIGDPIDQGGPIPFLTATANAENHFPLTTVYDDAKATYEAQMATGDKVWMYTCLNPGGAALNKFIDKPVWQMKSIVWLSYVYGVAGHLHWSWNGGWTWGADPIFKEPDRTSFKGDDYIVYPDVANNKIASSIRQSAMRDGSEEFEVIRLAGLIDNTWTKSQIAKIVTSNTTYSSDIALMISQRDLIYRVASEQILIADTIVNPVISSATATNGMINVVLVNDPTYAPVAADFTAVASINGAADQPLAITSVTYNASTKTATVAFNSLPQTAELQSVVAKVSLNLDSIVVPAAPFIINRTASLTITEGLLAYYSFNNPSNLLHDDSNYNNHAVLYNGSTTLTSTTGGVSGGGLNNSGIQKGIKSPANLINPKTTSMTVSMWIKPAAANWNGNSPVLLAQDDSGFPGRTFIYPKGNTASTTTLTTNIDGVTGRELTTTNNTLITTGTGWNHVVLTSDAVTKKVAVYVNNVKNSLVPEPVVFEGSLGGLVFGNHKSTPSGSAGRPLVGLWDEISIFNRVLTDAEVTTLFTSPSLLVDKVPLDTKILEAAALVQANYTSDSWTAFQTALTAAQTVAADINATQAEVNAALLSLTNAMTALVNVYTVAFDSQGGSPVSNITGILNNAFITAPADPTYTGFTFSGWYKEAACTTPWDFATDIVSVNTTLYAKWTHTVAFDSQGGTAVSNITGIMNNTLIAAPVDPAYAGFDFSGWYKEAVHTTPWNFATDIVSVNATLFAKWTHTVTFDSQGGGVVPNITGILNNTMLTAPTDPAYTGYSFGGWYKEAACTTPWDFAIDVVTLNATLYAKWIPAITINSAPASITVTEGETASFMVTASIITAAPINYQWYLSSTSTPGIGDVPIAGATANILNIDNTTIVDHGGKYIYCVVNAQDATAVTTAPALLNVSPILTPVVSITTQPIAQTVMIGGSVSFITAASVTTVPIATPTDSTLLSYQWYENSTNSITNGTPVSNAISATLSLSNILFADNGKYYYCVVSYPGAQDVPTNAVLLTVQPTVITVNTQPLPQSVAAGQSATFTVSASTSDSTALTYQWYSSTTPAPSPSDLPITGAVSNVLNIDNTNAVDHNGKYYYCEIGSADAVSVKSAAANLTVITPLDAVAGLTWNMKSAGFTAVQNAASYEIQLYKDGILVGSPVESLTNSYDFAAQVTAPGSYSFKVTAKGVGLYSNGPPSDFSANLIIADKAALLQLVNSTGTLNPALYTQDSWSAFSAELAAANAVLNNSAVSQTTVDTAFAALQAAINGLTALPVDKTALAALSDTAATKVQGDYTVETWPPFAAAVANATDVLNRTSATQAEVDSAFVMLQTAMNALVAKPIVPTIDKTALSALAATANTKAQSDYTPQSWAPFATALSNATAVLNNTSATQVEVDSAQVMLQTAMNALVAKPITPTVDKTALSALAAAANTKVQSNYTPQSWAPFATALSNATAVLNNASATQSEVDAAVLLLQGAINALVVPAGTGEPNESDDEEQPADPVEAVVVVVEPEKPVIGSASPFKDISKHWAEDKINKAYAQGWVNGFGDSTFRPDHKLTRAQFTKMIVDAYKLQLPDDSKVSKFKDINGHWASGAIKTAYSNGIIFGISEEEFSPDTLITREQAVTIIIRLYDKLGVGNKSPNSSLLPDFTDKADVSAYAVDSVKRAADLKIIVGRPNNVFDPKGLISRAEGVTVLLNALELKK